MGEEAICERLFDGARPDGCYAESESALVCLDRDAWQELKQARRTDGALQRDMLQLEDWIRKQHFVKKRWRSGIINNQSHKTSSTVIMGSVASIYE